MTVTIVWVRTVGSSEELIFASDSRLSGDGATMDYCPKILTFSRSDCAICFAGYTGRAYAIMNQLSFAIEAHWPLRRRAMDLRKLRAHALKIFDSMIDSIETSIDELLTPDVNFIFGGYSWINKEFDIWNINYDSNIGRFISRSTLHAVTNSGAGKVFFGTSETAARTGNVDLGKIDFGGDQGGVARKMFEEYMNSRFDSNPSLLDSYKLDMEPLEILRDMLRDSKKAHTIGGAPQIVKVYQHMNALPVAIYWPDKRSGQAFLYGRPLLGYENVDSWILDPDTLRTSHPKHSLLEDEETKT